MSERPNTTYVPPEILNDMDEETIHARMMRFIPSAIDKTKGGFAYDFTRPAAIEKADMVILLNEIVQLFFPEWSHGIYLDLLGGQLTRKAATAAETTLQITGTPGTEIPEGYVFSTESTAISPSITFAAVEAATIGEEGTAEVRVRCTQTGILGNVPANSIILMTPPIIRGVESITNHEPAIGGTDLESDDDYRLRIMERDRQNELSHVGNDYDYRRWAQEVDGVGSVIVIPEWMGAGTGTVKLVIMDRNGMPANQSIIDAVYQHIMSPDDRNSRLAPIEAKLTVVAASRLSITITADMTLDHSIPMDDISSLFQRAVELYFTEAKEDGCIRYTRIGSILSETAGVMDYANLRINDSTENIAIGLEEYPQIDSITLSEAES